MMWLTFQRNTTDSMKNRQEHITKIQEVTEASMGTRRRGILLVIQEGSQQENSTSIKTVTLSRTKASPKLFLYDMARDVTTVISKRKEIESLM